MKRQCIELENSTVFIHQAERPGNTALIIAGIHGNERCGVEACENFLKDFEIQQGKLIVIYANKEAIARNTRCKEYNLNRCFLKQQPEAMAVSLEGRTAKALMPYLNEADVLLDLHASFSLESQPFVICDEKNVELAKIFSAEKVLTNIDAFHPGSTDAYMNNQGKIAFCSECGYLGDEKATSVAEEAIRAFLQAREECFKNLPQRKQAVYKVVTLFRNTKEPFKMAREFKDFEELKEKTLIGYEGEKSIFGEKDDVLLFVRNAPSINEECFLVAQKLKT